MMKVLNNTIINITQNLTTILKKCKTLNHLNQIQTLIITIGNHHNTQYPIFLLIRFSILNLSNIQHARKLFNSINSPNIYHYSAMINAYASVSDHLSSFTLYKKLVCYGKPRANHFVYRSVLKASSELMGSNGLKMVHTQIVKTGFGCNPGVETGLVDCYGRYCLDVCSARQVFDEMSVRNVVSWTVMISGYVRVGGIGDAVVLFDVMPVKDVPSWNAIISGCNQNGLFDEAISYLRKMMSLSDDDKKIKPNQISFACALSACGHTGMFHLGKEIHGYIVRNGFNLDSDSYMLNALIDLYGKCGCLQVARRVFETTRNKSLTSWNSMISCYALHGESKNSIEIFEEMLKVGDDNLKPDGITFIGLLNACTHGGLVEKGYYYYDLMINVYFIKPKIEHYGCMVDLLGRSGHFEKVMEIITEMKVAPDELIWGALLNGCKIHRNVELAELAIKKLIEIDPNNGGYVAMLANLYVELGKWDEVRQVRKVMVEKGVSKVPGCSWIEVDCGS